MSNGESYDLLAEGYPPSAGLLPNIQGRENPWIKGSVCLVLEFALPPFSPIPSVVEVSKQTDT